MSPGLPVAFGRFVGLLSELHAANAAVRMMAEINRIME
jgi:hypothetical protein